jgi:O-antigen ligase
VEPFGPFVNKNHFAGWMLLALPLVIALLCAGIERSMRGVKPGVRNRVLWLSSPEANKLLLLATVAIVMGLSLVLTMSRSGMGALAVAVGVMGWLVARGIRSRSRRAVARGYLLFLTLIIVGWIGTDTIVSRFSDARWSEFNNRRGAWADALNVAATFPLTGTGLGTYATTSYFYQRHDLSKYYSEAHNDYFQLAAEGGLLVGLPILLCVGIFVNEVRIRMRDPPGSTAWWLRRGAITALVAISLQEVVEFSLQMPGNAVLFAVVAAIAIHQAPPAGPNQSPASRPYAAQAVSMRGLPLDGMEAAPSPPV